MDIKLGQTNFTSQDASLVECEENLTLRETSKELSNLNNNKTAGLLRFARNDRKAAFTSTVTNGIDFVTDVNGSHGPNKETADNKYNDIRNLTIAKFTNGCAGTDIPGIGCVVNVGTSYDAVGTYVYAGSTYPNYWEGAKAKCASMGMTLPDRGTLKSIYNQKGNYDTLPQTGWFWSSSEDSTSNAWLVSFSNRRESSNNKGYQRGVLCVGN